MGRHYLILPVKTLTLRGLSNLIKVTHVADGRAGTWACMTDIKTCVLEDLIIQELKHNCTKHKAWYAAKMQEGMCSTMICMESRKRMIQNSGLQRRLGAYHVGARPSTGYGENESIYFHELKFHAFNIYFGGIYFKTYIWIWRCVNKLSIIFFTNQDTLLIWSKEEWVICLSNSWETMVGRIMTP